MRGLLKTPFGGGQGNHLCGLDKIKSEALSRVQSWTTSKMQKYKDFMFKECTEKKQSLRKWGRPSES